MAATYDHLQNPVQGRAGAGVFLGVCGLLLLGIGALWPDAVSLSGTWRHTYDYSHGYLIAAIAALWLVQLRQKIAGAGIRPMGFGLPVLLLAQLAWLVAYRGNSDLLRELLLPVILWLSVWVAAGTRIALVVAAPLAFLYFAIPVWEHLVPLLQQLTTAAAQLALSLLHVPATVTGNEVTIPSGMFQIAEGCSGKRYLIVTLPMAVLMGTMHRLSPRRMGVLLAAAVALALVTNWIRVITIIWFGYVTHMQSYLVAVEHLTFGWLLFLPLTLLVILLSRWLGRREAPREPAASISGADRPASLAWTIPVVVLLLLQFAVVTFAADGRVAEVAAGALPVTTGQWQGPVPVASSWRPQFTGADVERTGAYRADGHDIAVYVNLYRSQQPGKELVYYSNGVVPESWSHATGFGPGADVLGQLNVLVAQDGSGEQWLVASVYNVDGTLTTHPLVAQVVYGARAWLRPVPAGLVAVATACSPDCTAAAARLASFWQQQGINLVSFIRPAQL